MGEGRLYIVATPIGNLSDITSRAIDVLRAADIVAAEDTRHSRKLLTHFDIDARLIAVHEHNEDAVCADLVGEMRNARSVALISDAGTPLVSDPGYRLVRAALAAGLRVIPVPGPSALIAALSAAGMPTDRFCFEGFPAARAAARRSRLAELRAEPRTLVFYEAPHRVAGLVADAADAFGGDREVAVARELTKQFEQIWHGDLAGAQHAFATGDIPTRGEFVVIIGGADEAPALYDELHLMEALLSALAPSAAAAVASRITGGDKRHFYELALKLKQD